MNANATHLPDASDIGLDILIFRRASPLWMVYDAMLAGEKVLAWRFLPAHVRASQDGSKLWPLLPDWAVASDASADQMGIAPRMTAYSHSSNSGWLVYPATPLAVDKPLNDRKKLADLSNHLLTALDRLHSRETLHLDVHPNNVRDNKGQFCLVGLGADVRKQAGATTASNEGLARKGYSAPEMWDASGRSKLGPWTDIFAAAATMYFAICGKAPADFRERIDKPRWREAVAYDLNRELAKSGAAWPKMVEFIIAGLAPKIEDRPKTVSEWSRIWKEPLRPITDPKSAKSKKPPSELRNAATLAGGFLASWLSLYLFSNYVAPVYGVNVGSFIGGGGMEIDDFWGKILPYAFGHALLLVVLLFQISAVLILDNAFPNMNDNFRNGFLWHTVIVMFVSTWLVWADNFGWDNWFNVAGCVVIMASLSSIHDKGRVLFLRLGTMLLVLVSILSYFHSYDFDGLAFWA